MYNMRTSALVFYTILIGILSTAIAMIFSQLDMEYSATQGVAVGWYYQLAFIGNILLTIASVYSFIQYQNRFPKVITFCYVSLVLLVVFASLKDYQEFMKTPSLFYSPKGVGTWINFGLLYFVAEEYYSTRIVKWFRLICFATILFNFYQIVSLKGISSRSDSLYVITDTTVFIFWTYPFFFLDSSDKNSTSKIGKYAIMLLVASFAFFISSRSYMLIALFYILVKLKRDLSDRRNALAFLFLFGVFLLVVFVTVSKLQDVNIVQGALSIFSDRITEDSRSSQLVEFMSQYDDKNLFSGLGPTAKWLWSGYDQGYYEWLDNQYVLIIWWFGIQTCIIYLLFLICGLFKKSIADTDVKNGKFVIFFWILACAGFAIYVNISTKSYYYFITLLMGKITLNQTALKNSRKAVTF